MPTLLTPKDVDRLLVYPSGRALRLARAGKLPCITLPDGSIRFDEAEISQLLISSSVPTRTEAKGELVNA